MEKLKLRFYVIPTLSILLLFGLFATTFFMQTSGEPSEQNEKFMSDTIIGNKLPVIKEEKKIIYPYTDSNVKIGKTYYDYKADEDKQKNSIIKYDDTYMQNSGIDFISDNSFNVISVLDGEVINVSEDELLGKVVKIEHSNGYISVYQSLENVDVKQGDKVIQSQVIGKSGNNKIDEALKNHLHFELYLNGQMLNPEEYLDKSIN